MISAEFVKCDNLRPGALVEVETRNRRYHIECLGGRRIRISGHPDFCPTAVTARLRGSSDGDGVLEPGLIGAGRHLSVLIDDRLPITTSKVLKLRIQQPEEISLSPSSLY
jgi:hypothetical protein